MIEMFPELPWIAVLIAVTSLLVGFLVGTLLHRRAWRSCPSHEVPMVCPVCATITCLHLHQAAAKAAEKP